MVTNKSKSLQSDKLYALKKKNHADPKLKFLKRTGVKENMRPLKVGLKRSFPACVGVKGTLIQGNSAKIEVKTIKFDRT